MNLKVAIASGKGGTGKTTLATNLASVLSGTYKTVLADLDVEEPDSGLFIKGFLLKEETRYKLVPGWDEKKCTLCGVCQEVCNFNALMQMAGEILVFPQLCHSCHACSELCPESALPMKKQRIGTISHFRNGKMEFTESRLDVGQEQAVPLISQSLKYLEKTFSDVEFILLDSPPGTSCPVIEVAREADFVILVTEPTPFGLHDLKLAVDTMKEIRKRFAVVVNRSGSGSDEVYKYCRDENIAVIASIPDNRKIAELYARGELLLEKIPELKVSLENISEYLVAGKEGDWF